MANDKDDRKTYGLLGKNINYSLSPAMHNAAFRHFGIPAEYKLFDVRENELDGFVRDRVLTGEISGFNVTVPYKMKMREVLEKIPIPEENFANWVRITGALNTVKVEKENITAYNTDIGGFYKSLVEDAKYDPQQGGAIFVIGAGGAGRALSLYLAHLTGLKTSVNVYDTEKERLDSLEDAFKRGWCQEDSPPDKLYLVKSTADIPKRLQNCRLVINATPLGTKEGDPLPVNFDYLKKGQVVYDLVYARETELLKLAKEKGLVAVNGLGMLVNQAALSFEIWTGMSSGETRPVMRSALEEKMGK